MLILLVFSGSYLLRMIYIFVIYKNYQLESTFTLWNVSVMNISSVIFDVIPISMVLIIHRNNFKIIKR